MGSHSETGGCYTAKLFRAELPSKFETCRRKAMSALWRKPVAASSEERSAAARRGSGLWLLLRRSRGRKRGASHIEPPPTLGAGQATRKSDSLTEAGERSALQAAAHANAGGPVPGLGGTSSQHYAATPPRRSIASPFASRRPKTPLADQSPLHPTPSFATPGIEPYTPAQTGSRKKTRRKQAA